MPLHLADMACRFSPSFSLTSEYRHLPEPALWVPATGTTTTPLSCRMCRRSGGCPLPAVQWRDRGADPVRHGMRPPCDPLRAGHRINVRRVTGVSIPPSPRRRSIVPRPAGGYESSRLTRTPEGTGPDSSPRATPPRHGGRRSPCRTPTDAGASRNRAAIPP